MSQSVSNAKPEYKPTADSRTATTWAELWLMHFTRLMHFTHELNFGSCILPRWRTNLWRYSFWFRRLGDRKNESLKWKWEKFIFRLRTWLGHSLGLLHVPTDENSVMQPVIAWLESRVLKTRTHLESRKKWWWLEWRVLKTRTHLESRKRWWWLDLSHVFYRMTRVIINDSRLESKSFLQILETSDWQS